MEANAIPPSVRRKEKVIVVSLAYRHMILEFTDENLALVAQLARLDLWDDAYDEKAEHMFFARMDQPITFEVREAWIEASMSYNQWLEHRRIEREAEQEAELEAAE